MNLMLDGCIEYDEDRKVCVASENGKKYTLNNASNYKVKKVKVDGCIPQKKGEHRCDFLMYATRDEDRKAIFIELKGGALIDAVQQVYDTVVYLKPEVAGSKIYVRIVGSGDVPDFKNSPHYRKLVREIESVSRIRRATNKVLIENIENI